MTKGPDLSAFPIPRKGGARPISMGELSEADVVSQEEEDVVSQEEEGDEAGPKQAPESVTRGGNASSVPAPRPDPTPKRRTLPPIVPQPPSTTLSGQVVATTVKLNEGRYLRLVKAGQPGPGRLKRRTIQEMMVEAIDEWFDRRGL